MSNNGTRHNRSFLLKRLEATMLKRSPYLIALLVFILLWFDDYDYTNWLSTAANEGVSGNWFLRPRSPRRHVTADEMRAKPMTARSHAMTLL